MTVPFPHYVENMCFERYVERSMRRPMWPESHLTGLLLSVFNCHVSTESCQNSEGIGPKIREKMRFVN
jgi:hypothetical protein